MAKSILADIVRKMLLSGKIVLYISKAYIIVYIIHYKKKSHSK